MSTSAIAIPLSVPSETLERGRVKPTDRPQPPSEIKLARPMNELDQTTDRLPDDRDNLQELKGIGPAIEQALNSRGIYRFADLLDFTPDSLTELLKADIPYISPKYIERYDLLNQVRDLVRGQQRRRAPRSEADETPAPSADGQKGAGKAPLKDWRELADFFVSFGFAIGKEGEEKLQTKAHHSQADKPQEWDGIATAQLTDWMLSQANLPLPAEIEAPVEEGAPAELPSPATPYNAQIKILEAKVSETGPSSGVPERRLRAEVRFQVSGAEAKTLTADCIPFRVEVHVVDLKSRASNLVAAEGRKLQPRIFEYISQQAFPLPDLGRYELHTVVLLLPPGEMMTFHRGPTFRVVP